MAQSSTVNDLALPSQQQPLSLSLGKARLALVILGLLLGMLLAALDQTVVGTAMPRIVTRSGRHQYYLGRYLVSTGLDGLYSHHR